MWRKEEEIMIILLGSNTSWQNSDNKSACMYSYHSLKNINIFYFFSIM